MASVNLFIQTAFAGDLLLSTPVIKRIHKLFPDHKLAILCRKGFGDFLLQTHLAHQVYEVDKSNRESLKSITHTLKDQHFDHIFSPHESFRTATVVRSLKAKKKIGYKKWWNFWAFHQRYPRPMNYPEVLRQFTLLQDLDSEIGKELKRLNESNEDYHTIDLKDKIPPWANMSLIDWIKKNGPEAESSSYKRVSKIIDQITDPSEASKRPLVFLAPGSVWATKCWTVEGYSAIGKYLADKGYQVIVLGAPNEQETANRVCHQIPNVINLAGQTSIFESFLLLKKGKYLICNDSGAMHLGATADIPTLAIFGPTVLSLGYRPWQEKAIVVEKDLSCRPCGKHGHRRCPIKTHECMKAISPRDIISQLDKTLLLC